MPIDIDEVLGAELRETTASWRRDDVILYQLGLGAGAAFTDPAELAYVYEDELKVLPSFAVIPSLPCLVSIFELPGFDVDHALALHGEQELIMHEALPPAAEVSTSGRVTDLFDKRTGTLAIAESVTRAREDDRPLFTNRHSFFLRGEHGYGKPGGPLPELPPDRAADHVVRRATLPQQALIYRLSGDKNPIHADPAYAARGGFDRPIMHGLCTFGMTCKEVVDTVFDGDVASIGHLRARFSGVFFPGETLEVSMWEEPRGVVVTARSVERDVQVLSNGLVAAREQAEEQTA